MLKHSSLVVCQCWVVGLTLPGLVDTILSEKGSFSVPWAPCSTSEDSSTLSVFINFSETERRICGPRTLHKSKYCNPQILRALLLRRAVKSRISLNVELMKLLNAAALKCNQKYVQGERNLWCPVLFVPNATNLYFFFFFSFSFFDFVILVPWNEVLSAKNYSRLIKCRAWS